MRKAFLLVFLLAWAAVAHEGGRHASLRDGKPDEVVEQRQVSQNGKNIQVELRRWPSEPVVGQTVGFLLTVREKLKEPDPLLGDALPLEGKASLREEPPLPFHAEQESGNYGLDWKPESSGSYRLTIQFETGQGDPWSLEHEVSVSRSSRGQRLFWGGWLTAAASLTLALAPWAGFWKRMLLVAPLAGLTAALFGLSGMLPEAAATAPVAVTPTPASDQVHVSAKLQDALEIRVETVALQRLTGHLEVPGTLVVPPGRSQVVTAPVTGKVLAVDARVGEKVRAGQTLAALEELVTASEQATVGLQAQALEASRQDLAARNRELSLRRQELRRELEEARHQASQRRYELTQAQQLYGLEVMARQDMVRARFAEEEARARVAGLERERREVARQLEAPLGIPAADEGLVTHRSVEAPITGTVSDLRAASGQQVQAGQTLFQLVDVGTLWVEALIPEADLARARQARVAEVRPASGGVFQARRVLTAPQLDPQTRTLRVSYQLPNPNGTLLANMSATVRLMGLTRQELAVPREAVLDAQNGRGQVFVRLEPEVFEPRTVVLGEGDAQRTVIREGLRAGDEVVVQGASQLQAELQRRSPRQEP